MLSSAPCYMVMGRPLRIFHTACCMIPVQRFYIGKMWPNIVSHLKVIFIQIWISFNVFVSVLEAVTIHNQRLATTRQYLSYIHYTTLSRFLYVNVNERTYTKGVNH